MQGLRLKVTLPPPLLSPSSNSLSFVALTHTAQPTTSSTSKIPKTSANAGIVTGLTVAVFLLLMSMTVVIVCIATVLVKRRRDTIRSLQLEVMRRSVESSYSVFVSMYLQQAYTILCHESLNHRVISQSHLSVFACLILQSFKDFK